MLPSRSWSGAIGTDVTAYLRGQRCGELTCPTAWLHPVVTSAVPCHPPNRLARDRAGSRAQRRRAWCAGPRRSTPGVVHRAVCSSCGKACPTVRKTTMGLPFRETVHDVVASAPPPTETALKPNIRRRLAGVARVAGRSTGAALVMNAPQVMNAAQVMNAQQVINAPKGCGSFIWWPHAHQPSREVGSGQTEGKDRWA